MYVLQCMYSNVYFKILYYFIISMALSFLFIFIMLINNNEKFQIFIFCITNSTGLLIISLFLLIIFWPIKKCFKILSGIGIFIICCCNHIFFYFCIVLFFPVILIIIYRLWIIHNLNNEIEKINKLIDNEENKIKKIGKGKLYWKQNFDDKKYEITLLKGNVKDKAREIFIKKMKNEYVLTKDENGYKEIKEEIKEIYKKQTLKMFFKELAIIIPPLSFIGKYFFEDLKGKIEIIELIKNNKLSEYVKNAESVKDNIDNIIEIIAFIFIMFFIILFFYKLLGLIYRFKRERIEQVAECIEILYRREENDE